jgi:hypothetical protein
MRSHPFLPRSSFTKKMSRFLKEGGPWGQVILIDEKPMDIDKPIEERKAWHIDEFKSQLQICLNLDRKEIDTAFSDLKATARIKESQALIIENNKALEAHVKEGKKLNEMDLPNAYALFNKEKKALASRILALPQDNALRQQYEKNQKALEIARAKERINHNELKTIQNESDNIIQAAAEQKELLGEQFKEHLKSYQNIQQSIIKHTEEFTNLQKKGSIQKLKMEELSLELFDRLNFLGQAKERLLNEIKKSPSDHLPLIIDESKTGMCLLTANIGGILGEQAYDGYVYDSVLGEMKTLEKRIQAYNSLLKEVEQKEQKTLPEDAEKIEEQKSFQQKELEDTLLKVSGQKERMEIQVQKLADMTKKHPSVNIINLQEAGNLELIPEIKKLYTELFEEKWHRLALDKGHSLHMLVKKEAYDVLEIKDETGKTLKQKIEEMKSPDSQRIQAVIMRHKTGPLKGELFILLNCHLNIAMPLAAENNMQNIINTVNEASISILKGKVPIVMAGDLNAAFYSDKIGPTAISVSGAYSQCDAAIRIDPEGNQTILESQTVNPDTLDAFSNEALAIYPLDSDISRPKILLDHRSSKQKEKSKDSLEILRLEQGIKSFDKGAYKDEKWCVRRIMGPNGSKSAAFALIMDPEAPSSELKKLLEGKEFGLELKEFKLREDMYTNYFVLDPENEKHQALLTNFWNASKSMFSFSVTKETLFPAEKYGHPIKESRLKKENLFKKLDNPKQILADMKKEKDPDQFQKDFISAKEDIASFEARAVCMYLRDYITGNDKDKEYKSLTSDDQAIILSYSLRKNSEYNANHRKPDGGQRFFPQKDTKSKASEKPAAYQSPKPGAPG